jgi:hypothetical protein
MTDLHPFYALSAGSWSRFHRFSWPHDVTSLVHIGAHAAWSCPSSCQPRSALPLLGRYPGTDLQVYKACISTLTSNYQKVFCGPKVASLGSSGGVFLFRQGVLTSWRRDLSERKILRSLRNNAVQGRCRVIRRSEPVHWVYHGVGMCKLYEWITGYWRSRPRPLKTR